MADIIETAGEFRRVMREEAEAGRVNCRTETKVLREALRVGDAVKDWQIDRIVTETFRSDENAEVVFTLGGGMVVAQIHVPVDVGISVGEELWQVTGELSALHGGDVWLTPAPADAFGYGIVTAYRVPPEEYRADDWKLVERFGVEHGRFQQSREPSAA